VPVTENTSAGAIAARSSCSEITADGEPLALMHNAVPVEVGARRPDRLAEALGAVDVRLSDDDRAAIEAAVPPGAAAGERYDAAQMAMLDSER